MYHNYGILYHAYMVYLQYIFNYIIMCIFCIQDSSFYVSATNGVTGQ